MVTEIDPDGVASEHGLKSGDVILEVGGAKVATATDVRKAVGDAKKNGKHAVLMRVKSDDMTKFIAIPLGRALTLGRAPRLVEVSHKDLPNRLSDTRGGWSAAQPVRLYAVLHELSFLSSCVITIGCIGIGELPPSRRKSASRYAPGAVLKLLF